MMKKTTKVLIIALATVMALLFAGCQSAELDDNDSVYMKLANEYTQDYMKEMEASLNEYGSKINVSVKLTDFRIDDLIYIAEIDGYKLFRYHVSYVADDDEKMMKLAAGPWTQSQDGRWEDRAPKYLVFTGDESPKTVGVLWSEFTPANGKTELFMQNWTPFLEGIK